MALQRLLAVKGRVLQDGSDGLQLQPQLPVKEDGLEPVHLLGTVDAVACFGGPQGLQQPLTVVPAQGAGCDAGQLRQRLDGVFHVHPS